jgi:hypothetical protein
LSDNPPALASQHLPSTREQLSKLQQGQFEWLLSVPVKTSAQWRGPRGDSHGDAELRQGEKTLYFGCNLVQRRSRSGSAHGKGGKPTDVYTLLATRIEAVEGLMMDIAGEGKQTGAAPADQHSGTRLTEPREGGLDVPRSPQLAVGSREHSRPVSRIEDSVEALDKLEEEIEALAEMAHLERVLSPEAANARKQNKGGAKTTAPKRAASVRTGANSGRGKPMQRSSSMRNKAASTPSAQEDEKTAVSGSGARRVPRPTSLLPPKPPARSNKPPTVSKFQLPGEAVARRLKEQREQRRSQQISSEDAAALAAAYSPAKPHFKSTKPPTVPTFELPGEAVARRLKEQREQRRSQQVSSEDAPYSPPKPSHAKASFKSPTRPTLEHPSPAKPARPQDDEERKRREFKARPYRGSQAPSTVPRETLASLARQKLRQQQQSEGSSDSVMATTVATTPAGSSKKRHSFNPASTSASRPSDNSNNNNNTDNTATASSPRGRGPAVPDPSDPTTRHPHEPHNPSSSRATSASTGSTRSSIHSAGKHHHQRSTPSTLDEAQQQQQHKKLSGREVFARDGAYAAERERERRAREEAAKVARREAAERSRMLSREWAERQKVKQHRAGRRGEKGGKGDGQCERERGGQGEEQGQWEHEWERRREEEGSELEGQREQGQNEEEGVQERQVAEAA